MLAEDEAAEEEEVEFEAAETMATRPKVAIAVKKRILTNCWFVVVGK